MRGSLLRKQLASKGAPAVKAKAVADADIANAKLAHPFVQAFMEKSEKMLEVLLRAGEVAVRGVVYASRGHVMGLCFRSLCRAVCSMLVCVAFVCFCCAVVLVLQAPTSMPRPT
jgi:hypothetical protein